VQAQSAANAGPTDSLPIGLGSVDTSREETVPKFRRATRQKPLRVSAVPNLACIRANTGSVPPDHFALLARQDGRLRCGVPRLVSNSFEEYTSAAD
jgi:hypothetical protein